MYLYAALAFVVTFLITPPIAQIMKTKKITGRDVHKPIQPEIPEMGGVSYICALTLVFGLAFIFLQKVQYLAALCVLLITAVIGAYDDVKGLHQTTKVVLTFFAGIPLFFFVTDTSIDFVIDSVDFSWGYYLLVLMAVAACSNATNILAGFNGEEVGLGAIASCSLGISCIILNIPVPQLLLFSLSLSLLAFLVFNRYPAHIFPGDVGTLPIGALIAVSVIFGKIELLGFIALLPAIIEFFLKMKIKFTGKEYGPTKVVNGILCPPPYVSVANLLTSTFPLTEKTLVYTLWILGGICGIISVLLAFFMA
jgi:UDP-N-acetylglucosamine--dolichyl-phosphate N-acetylglucosaminephosphotransferase